MVETGYLTIKRLKEILKDMPDEDENGDLFEVWIEGPQGLSNQVFECISLNQKSIGSSILLSPKYED
jgi:hypothetical protein